MKLKLLWAAVALALSPQVLSAQSLDEDLCNDHLDEAKRAYEEGQLEEVGDLIRDCLANKKAFPVKAKREEGYKLLTESYLFRNDLDDATRSFEELLKINPLYEADSLNPNNSYDLIYLSRTYRHKPLVSIYGNIGANNTRLQTLETYNVDNNNYRAENYNQFVLGFSGAIGVEMPIWRDFTLALEGNFALRSYRAIDSMFLSAGLQNPAQNTLQYSSLQFDERQYWIDIPLMLRYEHYFKRYKKVIPYAYIGGAPNFLLSASVVNIQRNTTRESDGGGAVVGGERSFVIAGSGLSAETQAGEADRLSLREGFNVSLLAGAGAKIRLGHDFVIIEARYNRFLMNSVNRENRYSNPELLYEYGHVDNDFRMDNYSLTIGFEKSFYKPRKKRQYNEVYINRRLNKIIKKEKRNAKRTTDSELKRELNSFVRELERDQPGIIEDVRRGRASSKVIDEIKDKASDIKGN
ncbi:outer membrane beta-barrel protein [Saprospira grandis]|uniref:outer membrane beta-barrel protein n=1 Tax=Saprospira grandis TaxID=1008 RepID=UPI0022DE4195|nr:outer membrane beta-barrel protein [Saprospira grandis]WBM75594.1 outer membrane beta-barrel protein [Saprospira grandis]